MTQYQQVATKVERLRAQAAEAAAVREALEDPSVVALMVERKRKFGEGLNWAAIGILAVFCIVTVHDFVSRDVERYSLEWFGAWFLEPGLISGLIGILIWEGVTSRWGVPSGPWTRAAKWGLLGSTLTMNVWMSVAGRSYGGIVAHTVPPLVIVLLTEARIESLLNLTECVRKAHEAAVQRKEALIAEQLRLAEEAAQAQEAEREGRLANARTDAQIETLRSETNVQTARDAAAAAAARTGPVVFGETVPDRSADPAQTGLRVVPLGPEFTPAVRSGPVAQTAQRTVTPNLPDRSADRPAGRSAEPPETTTRTGPVRHRKSGKKPRTDEQLTAEIRDLTEANGGTPLSAYQLKQRFGVGSDRAARLLELATTAADGDAAAAGAAARQETNAK